MPRVRSMVCITVLASAIACSDDPSGIALGEAPRAYATAYCARLFACCEPTEIAERLRGFGPPADEPACVTLIERVFGNEFVDDTRKAEEAGHARYEPTAMEACASILRTESCSELGRVFSRMTLPASCPLVRVPRAQPNASCDHDFQCTTGYCEGGSETATGACVPLPAIGASCADGRCEDTAFCDRSIDPSGRCEAVLADGAPCASSLACASFSCNGSPGVCGPATTCNGI